MKENASVLIIDDEASICLAFKLFFEARGWSVHTAASAREGLAVCRERQPAVVFLDVRLPDGSGLDLLGELDRVPSSVIVMTAFGDFDTVIRAIQGRAFDYLLKPIDLDQALALAERVRDRAGVPAVAATTRTEPHERLVGSSPAMQAVYKLIGRVAAASSPVLIEGETGTGKELVARAIHRAGTRSGGPFVALNCGAIPDNLIESELFGHVRGAFTSASADRIGRFEAADGGTLLLDEIGELPLAVQVKLLRVLDHQAIERVGASRSIPVNVRVLAATNKNLEEEVGAGRFRRDLYYRLAVLRVSLPPLRDRPGDIPLLANHFLRMSSGPPASMGNAALQLMLDYSWPGNVRELRNAVEHAVALAPDRNITADDLPESVRSGKPAERINQEKFRRLVVDFAEGLRAGTPGRSQRTLEAVERALIAFAMTRCSGNQSEAADYLGLHRNTLRNKLRELDIGAVAGEA